MKIIFLSSYDPQDNKSWSGTPKRMLDALKSMDAEIIIIGPYDSKIKKNSQVYVFCSEENTQI